MANRASLTVERLSKLKHGETLWDTGVRGFCARRQTGDAVTFYVKYRTVGRRMRWLKIGQYKSDFQPGPAREEAKRILGEVARGMDPQAGRESKRKEETVEALVTNYIEVTGKAKRLKPKTIADYTRIRDDIIIPKIGKTRASELTPADVEDLHKQTLGDRPYLANRVLALLRAAYNDSAPRLQLQTNPTRGIRKHHEERRTRFLSPDELKRLGKAMRDPKLIESEGIYAIAAVLFLLFTGRRKEECLSLKWDQLNDDMSMMAVHEHKSSRLKGTVYYALSTATINLLKTLPRIKDNPYAFPSKVKEGKHFVALDETWKRLCTAAEINNTRVHDLRRTHSTHAASIGIELLSNSKMLGHSSVQVTESVYTQVEAKNLKPAANRIASSLAAILNSEQQRRDRSQTKRAEPEAAS